MDLTDEERAMQAQGMDSLNNQKEHMKQSVKKWNSEKSANEEYIAQMRANKEARKREMEEMERMKAQLLEEEEEEDAAAAAMMNPDAPTEVKKVEAAVDPVQGNKSKEQLEMEEALAQRIRPLNLEGMDTDQLKNRLQEYWKAYSSLKSEKAQLAKRFEEQSHEIKEAQEKLSEIVLAKQAKKGVDMERLALGPGGKPSKHPPKKQMVSKYAKAGKGDRSYDERKDMYDVGVDLVRPKMLENVWQAKFSAWMEDDNAGRYLDGNKVEEEI